jgi:hypothetical protein
MYLPTTSPPEYPKYKKYQSTKIVHKNQKQSINNKTDRKETNNNSRYQS